MVNGFEVVSCRAQVVVDLCVKICMTDPILSFYVSAALDPKSDHNEEASTLAYLI